MALSGSITNELASSISMRFSWSATQSIASNASTVSWKVELITNEYGRINSTATKKYTCVINGKTITGTNTIGIDTNSTKTIASGSESIPHNTDGTKTFSFSFEQEFNISYSGSSWGNKTVSGTGALNKINRVSTITAQDSTIGKAIVINIKCYDSTFKHTLKYTFGNATGTIGSGFYAKATWHSSADLHNQLTNTQTSKSCTLTCETYTNNNILIGTTNTTITLKANSADCVPTMSATVKDTNTQTTLLTGNNQVLVRHQSIANYTISATAKYGAYIKSYKAECGGSSLTMASSNFHKVSSGAFTFTVVDSRGFSTTSTINLSLVEYINLTCDLVATAPTTAGVAALKISGNYFNGSFSSAESNVLTIVYRYKVSGGSYGDWQSSTATITKSGGTFSQDISVSGLDYTQQYTFQARAADKILTIESKERTVKTTPLFDWGENDFVFNVPVYAGGYNLAGLAKAFTTNYSLETTMTRGDYPAGSMAGTATLMGNNLRCYLYMTGVSQEVGIANKTLATFKIKHDGKIKATYTVDFPIGRSGVGYGSIASASNDGTYLTFNVRLNTVATAFTGGVNIYFTLPCSLDYDAF